MNEVQAIKNRNHIEQIKSVLHGRNLLLFTVGLNVGLRISDLLEIKVGELRNQDYVIIYEGKTKKSKTFALNKTVKQAVKKLIPKDVPDDEHVFKSRKSKPCGGSKAISRVQAYRILNDAIEHAGLSKVYTRFGAHSLRKTFGYFAHEAGTDISLLMRIFNHSSQKETLRYIGIEQDNLNDVYHAVNL